MGEPRVSHTAPEIQADDPDLTKVRREWFQHVLAQWFCFGEQWPSMGEFPNMGNQCEPNRSQQKNLAPETPRQCRPLCNSDIVWLQEAMAVGYSSY